jgi:hypothetical protein
MRSFVTHRNIGTAIENSFMAVALCTAGESWGGHCGELFQRQSIHFADEI